jgi:hypothetical protein
MPGTRTDHRNARRQRRRETGRSPAELALCGVAIVFSSVVGPLVGLVVVALLVAALSAASVGR